MAFGAKGSKRKRSRRKQEQFNRAKKKASAIRETELAGKPSRRRIGCPLRRRYSSPFITGRCLLWVRKSIVSIVVAAREDCNRLELPLARWQVSSAAEWPGLWIGTSNDALPSERHGRFKRQRDDRGLAPCFLITSTSSSFLNTIVTESPSLLGIMSGEPRPPKLVAAFRIDGGMPHYLPYRVITHPGLALCQALG